MSSISVRMRRSTSTKRAVGRALLIACLIWVTLSVVFYPRSASLNAPRTPAELAERYGGEYEETTLRWHDYGSIKTTERAITNMDTFVSVTIRVSSFRTQPGAAFAYRHWSPLKSNYGDEHDRPLGLKVSDSKSSYQGTQIRGLRCSDEGAPTCLAWVFWQFSGKTIQETRLVTSRNYTSYDQAVAEFAWIGQY